MNVINLISGPRNLSTALMYSFAQNPTVKVVDEPFYGYYLKNNRRKVDHPSAERIMATMELDLHKIIDYINFLSEENNVFVKGMAHHYLYEEPDFILNWENLFLVRHPKKLIASFSKVISSPTLDDIGLKKSADLFSYLKRKGHDPLVIDSDELLKNPANYLRLICERLRIPYTEKMLVWQKGGIPEDGLWAEHWYQNVHNSTGFGIAGRKDSSVPEHLQNLLQEALVYYKTLKKNILKNE